MSQATTVTLVGGPTALLEVGGVRLLTDPTFDPPGSYEPRLGVNLTKTAGPALGADEIGRVDVVLLSHDHHLDNLDHSGRDFLGQVPIVLTTTAGARRLGDGAIPLANWESFDVQRGDGPGTMTITGLPAQHGPDGSEALVGEVTGFLLAGDGLPRIYVSGDNASLAVLSSIANRVGAIDIAVLFVGGAQMPYLGEEYLTLPSAAAPEAVRQLGAHTVVPVHLDGWAHFSDDRDSLIRAFARSDLRDRLALPDPGRTLTLPDRAAPSAPSSAR